MTPEQFDALTALHAQVEALASSHRQLRQQIRYLDALCRTGVNPLEGGLTPDEIDRLVRLNAGLADLERYLKTVAQTVGAEMRARIADPSDPLDDYEIEARLHFQLREDDPADDEDDDNFLTERELDLTLCEGPAADADFRPNLPGFSRPAGGDPALLALP